MPAPNIILILCDQMRGDAFGAAGNPAVQTPNIDYLASRGTLFSHAYSAVPSCLPARAILWTGQNQWHTGVLGMGRGQGQIPNDFPHTLAGELTKAGYRTHMVGKGHFHPYRALMGFESTELDESGRLPDSDYRQWFQAHAPEGVTPDDHGVSFNSWHARPWHTSEHLHPTFWTMTRALDFLKTRDRSRPFFLNISFARPHSPYVPPPYYFNLCRPEDIPLSPVGEWAGVHDVPRDAAHPDAWHGKMTPAQVKRARAGYFGEISFIDSQIGRLINWIRRYDSESYRNAWIVFTSDHGDMQGDHNLWRKTYAYEGSSRIPLIVVPPGQAGNSRTGEVVELRDIMPTLLEAAGVLRLPPTVEGRSLAPLLNGPAPDWRKYIHGEHCACYSPGQEMQFVTDGLRKYIWFPRTGAEQFFDLCEDPAECRDLAQDPERLQEVDTWRGYLAAELEARNCLWSRDGKPFCPNDQPLVSPFKDARWRG